MSGNKYPEAILFDLDGTLFKAETLMEPAYFAMFDQLREEGSYEGETPPVERLLGGLGMLLRQIWERVLPGASDDLINRMNDLMLEHQLKLLENGTGELYEGVPEMLAALKEKGIRLFVASNGLEDYVKQVVQHKGISEYFEQLYSAGEFQTPSKAVLVRLLMDTHGVSRCWMVGDRSSDVEAGLKNGLTVVGCNYADFGAGGELTGAHHLITDIRQLPDLLD
ncbi:HAD family hydrolase [Paenibacillus senegalensis]|uniref:HAD family hydrolase n=1 Tax=Paenibacillus senegalensis TaxID=1465766 RepID=UPI000289FEBE|nr:HAD-IA family hydrolase [Paenibacillus senegalensis]